MAAHVHDVRLLVRRELTNFIKGKKAQLLSFRPMRAEFKKIINQSVFVPES